jgi:hypothetical protein
MEAVLLGIIIASNIIKSNYQGLRRIKNGGNLRLCFVLNAGLKTQLIVDFVRNVVHLYPQELSLDTKTNGIETKENY